MKLLGFINDACKVDSIKNMARQKRVTSFTKFSIIGFEQSMPQGNNWQEFLNDSENKDQLIEIIKQYVLEFGSGILSRCNPFLITSGKEKYFISHAGNQVIIWF